MKSQIRTAKPASHSGSHRKTAVPRVQTKINSSGTGNHRRSKKDSLEQQANDLAARAMRGEKNLARLITPTAAAGFHRSGEQGRPLPRALRESAETAFGADFGAVRIHAGNTADQAARVYEADAFASGRDIYFRAGRYSPHTSDGRTLLLHELTHVLQQTGRTSADGTLRATETLGLAAPQTKRSSPLTSSTAIPTFEEMADRHANASPSDKTLAKKITQIKAEQADAAKSNSLDAYWEKLSSYVRTRPEEYNELTSPISVRSFIYDCLKLAGKWDAAVYLLARDWDLQTTFFASEAYEAFPEGAVPDAEKADYNDFSYVLWSRHAFFEPFRLKQFLSATNTFLIGPSRSIQDLDIKNGKFEDIAAAKLSERDAPTGLIDNELFFVAIDTVRAVDRIRIKKTAEFARAESRGKPVASLTPVERAAVAGDLAAWAANAAKEPAQSPEIVALLSRLSAPLASTASGAKSFWSVADQLLGYATNDVQLKQLGDVRAGFKKFAQKPEVVALGNDISAATEALFKLDAEGNPLSSDAYAAARDTLIAKLQEKRFERFERPLLRAIESDKPEDVLVSAMYGWLFLQLFSLSDLLSSYDPAADVALVAEYAKSSPGYAGADMRIRHRRMVAIRLNQLAGVLNWANVARQADHALTPAAGEKSLLAIFGDFQAGSAGLDQLTKDFGGAITLTGAEPLTVGDIRVFFLLESYRAMATDLQASLNAEKAAPGSQGYGMVKHAIDVAEALPKPVRYTNQNFYGAIRVEDEAFFSPILRIHPKVQKLINDQTKDGLRPVTLTPLQLTGNELIVWVLPPMQKFAELVKRFQDITEFNSLIYRQEALKAGQDLVDNPDLTTIKSRPWDQWFRSFGDALRAEFPWQDLSFDEKTREAMRGGLDDFLRAALGAHEGLRTDFTTQQDATTALMRQASIFDRTKKRDYLVKLIGEYDRYDQFSVSKEMHILRFEIPNRVFDEITATVHLTAPLEDQALHQAALMLELAAAVSDKFQDSPRLDVMVAFIPLMEEAIDYARNKTNALRAVLVGDELKDEWISQQATVLEGLTRLFRALEQAQQREFGMQGVVNGSDKFLAAVDEGYVIRPGETFVIDGITYTLVDVRQNFVYHPRHGNEAPKLEDGKGGTLAMSIGLVELRYGESTKSTTLRGSDEELMTELATAVSLEAIVRQLNDLATYIQGFAELTMDIVELIPGPGQAVMAARLAVSILQFVASDEFEVLVDYVTNHPVEALKKFGQEIFALLNPSTLWEFLFFGNNAFDQLHATKTPPSSSKVPHTITEKLTRVIMRLYNFGKGVLGSFGRLQTHTRWRAEKMEIFVLGHPTLAWLVRLIADNIDYLAELTGEAAEFGGQIDEYRERAAKALNEWPDRVIETVEALRHLELPDEIIPMSDIVEIVVTMVLKRLPTKFRIASEVIMFLLDKFGKKQALFDTIADGVKDVGIDPNIPWREIRDEYLKKPFKEARNELAFTIFDLFGQIPTQLQVGPGQFNLLTPDQQTKFQNAAKTAQSDSDFEIQSVPADVWAFAPNGIAHAKPTALPRTAGAPLPRALRKDAERGFGRDLSHVRLHADAPAARFTQSVGAQALAGGSHIFLSPRVNPSTPNGRWVVNHELAHVVQQTPRQRSRAGAASQPTPVPRGHGVINDGAAERSASLAADALRQGRAAPELPPAPSGGGFQPFGLVDITRRLLDTLAGTTDVEHDEKKEEKTGASTGLKKLPPNIKTQIDKMWEGFGDALSNKTSYTAPFEQAKNEIIDHLTNKADPDNPSKAIQDALGDLAIDAVREKKEAGSSGKPDKITYELDVDRFAIALSRFIFAQSGVLIKFTLVSGIFGAAAGEGKNAPPTFSALNVVYVHLPEIHGNSKLWQNAINTVLGTKPHDKYLPRIRAYLEGKGPSLGIWNSKTYQLTQSVIDAVDAIIAASQAGMLDKSLLPPPAEYLGAQTPAGSANNIGLRLGKFGDAQQQGPERESHHITQYLLLEYFHGRSDKKPFPLLAKSTASYPGLKTSGSGAGATADILTAPSAQKPVDLAGWEDGRGGKMPAILLATPTHRTGRLHVTTKADDFTQGGNKSSAADSPSGVVHLKFREKLRARDDAYLKAQDKSEGTNSNQSQETFPAYVKRKNSEKSGAVQDTIYSAMQDTYHWMRNFMQPRLNDALTTIELKYYNDLGKDKGYKLSDTELKAVFAEAVIKNTTEMEKGGWY